VIDEAPDFVAEFEHGVRVRVKAVPGARRDAIAGPLGDRLKIRVSAPPEGGRANEAIRRLLAEAFAVSKADVALDSGPTSRDKVFEIAGDPAILSAAARSFV
jgi:uncharacterized protein (TIGR00251 family)